MLQLNNYDGIAPLLDSMPSLQTAPVETLFLDRSDFCGTGDSGDCCGICAECSGEYLEGSSMLLGGLSNAVNLELTASRGMV